MPRSDPSPELARNSTAGMMNGSVLYPVRSRGGGVHHNRRIAAERPMTPADRRRSPSTGVLHRISRAQGERMAWLLVAVGGAVGSVARYALSTFVLRATGTLFPLGTFVVNAVGCLCFGAVVGAADGRVTVSPEARAFILVGMLGGFTTFSSYVFES